MNVRIGLIAAHVSGAALVALSSCTGLDDVTEPSCAYAVSPPSVTVQSSGGSVQLAVTAAGVCPWTASDPPPWITLGPSRSGSGNGNLTLTVAANPGQTARNTTITVGGRDVPVTQDAAPCTFAIDPTSASFGPEGDRRSVMVQAASSCAWTAVSNVPWMSLVSGGQGSGDGLVEYDVAANTSSSSRTGTLTVAGRTFTVAQSGEDPVAPCSVGLSTDEVTVPAAGGDVTIGVTAPGGCSWTAESDSEWIRITSGGTGVGSGQVRLSIADTGSARTGRVVVGGQVVTVTQSGGGGQGGPTCNYSVTPGTLSVSASGGSFTVQVTAPDGCGWNAATGTSWIAINTASGSGDGPAQATVAQNSSPTPRTGTLTVAGHTVTVTQAGAVAGSCSFTVAPTSASFTTTGTLDSTIQVTAGAGCAWTATSNASWIAITSGASGTGAGTLHYAIPAYLGATARTGVLTVAGTAVTITQTGLAAGCTYAVSPQSFSFNEDRNDGSIQITAPAGCAWTATASDSWIMFRSSTTGSGSGPLLFSTMPNRSDDDRTGTITIMGQTVTVQQEGD
jgi:hypothetical protein